MAGPNSKNSDVNHSKTMILSSRGIISRHRHLMLDLLSLVSNSKKESKFDSKHNLADIIDVCELNDCDKVLFFESRKKEDLYMWIANAKQGPSFKFYVSNIHTLNELAFTGNSIAGISPILSFDSSFDSNNELKMVKDALVDIFGLPVNHFKCISATDTDRIYQFSYLDNKIWFRNYQIFKKETGETDLVEIGPRFVLTLLKIFEAAFCGSLLYKNDTFVSPNTIRSLLQQQALMRLRTSRNAASKTPAIPATSQRHEFDSIFFEGSKISDSE